MIKETKAHADFSIQDVIDGKVECSIDEWFRAFERTIQSITQNKFKDADDAEKARFACLSYMAVSSYAYHNEPRDLAEKTYPQFQMVILDLQREFQPFGLLLEAVQKRQFKNDVHSGLSNVDAVETSKKRFRNAFDRSMFPKAFEKAQMEIVWE